MFGCNRTSTLQRDPNKENLTKLEHTYTYRHTHPYTHKRNAVSQNPLLLFKPGDNKNIPGLLVSLAVATQKTTKFGQ